MSLIYLISLNEYDSLLQYSKQSDKLMVKSWKEKEMKPFEIFNVNEFNELTQPVTN